MVLSCTSCGREVKVGVKEEQTTEKKAATEKETKKEKATKEKDVKEQETEESTGAEENEKERADLSHGKSLTVRKGKEYKSEWDDDFNHLADLEYTVVRMGEEDEEQYKELAKALRDFNKTKKEGMESEYESMLSVAREEFSYSQGYFNTYFIEENITVRRADDTLFSFVCDGDWYQGGAHGMHYLYGYNYDTKTGKLLELADVTDDTEHLMELVAEELERTKTERNLYPDMDLKEKFQNPDYEPAWVIDYQGITFFFNPYEIAPYASGIQTVTISLKENANLIAKEYCFVPESYGMEVALNSDIYYDLDGDGTLEALSVIAYTGSDDTYDKQTIMIDQKEMLSDEIDGFSVDPVLLHCADGTNYLYIENGLLNDYGQLTVYRLDKKQVEKVALEYYAWHFESEEGDPAGQYVVTDPEDFLLDVHTDILSTVSGHQHFHVGEDGRPAAEKDWYDFNYFFELTLKKPLKVTIVEDETGEEKGSETLKEGTKVTYYRTDNQSFADLLLSDKRVARVQFERKEGMCYIDGTYIEDLFNGIMFAG